jgi:selenide,water dikinase
MKNIPFVAGAKKYAKLWTFPGGALTNSSFFRDKVRFKAGVPEEEQMLLFDPQTSGGLLLAIRKPKLGAFMEQMDNAAQPAWIVGQVVPGEGIEVI